MGEPTPESKEARLQAFHDEIRKIKAKHTDNTLHEIKKVENLTWEGEGKYWEDFKVCFKELDAFISEFSLTQFEEKKGEINDLLFRVEEQNSNLKFIQPVGQEDRDGFMRWLRGSAVPFQTHLDALRTFKEAEDLDSLKTIVLKFKNLIS